MRIKPSVTAQRSLTKDYWKEAKKVLYKTSIPVLEASDNMTPGALKNRLPELMTDKYLNEYLEKLWTKVGGKFANDTVRVILRKKALKDPEEEAWEEGFKIYTAERSKQIAKKILKTQVDYITGVIDKVLADALATGEAISTISGKIKEEFEREMVKMQNYEAERIARTEVIGASNKGSFDGARSTGANIKKGWLTSGLPGVRDTHLRYEAMGYLQMDTEFAPGLLHPGDPNGAPEEIINCRCTIIYDVD